MARAAMIWTPEFLSYRLSPAHPLNPVRLDLTMRLATALGVLDDVPLVEPDPATDAELLRVHTADFLAAVKALSVDPAGDPAAAGYGYGLGTPDNPIFPRMHEASALVCGGSLRGAQEIAAGRAERAVNIAGGLHHAMPDRASGFCVYNDCAVAVHWLLANGAARIAYVDVDVHHGDGVQAMFYDDPRVMTISLHQHPTTLFPGTGWPDETGGEGAEGTAVNVALPPGTADGAWLRAFHAVVPPVLEAFRPDVLVTQCGADSHFEDPLAELGLSVDGHRAIYGTLRDLALRHAGGRWLALGGGGYGLFRVVPRSWTHLVATMLDRDVEPATPLPADWVAHTAGLTNQPLPSAMTDDRDVRYAPWGHGSDPVDKSIVETRRAVFPAHGLDPEAP